MYKSIKEATPCKHLSFCKSTPTTKSILYKCIHKQYKHEACNHDEPRQLRPSHHRVGRERAPEATSSQPATTNQATKLSISKTAHKPTANKHQHIHETIEKQQLHILNTTKAEVIQKSLSAALSAEADPLGSIIHL